VGLLVKMMSRTFSVSLRFGGRWSSSSSINSTEPFSIVVGNQTIPYPRGAMRPIQPNQVYKFGFEAVSEMFNESHHSAKLLNAARMNYLDFRARVHSSLFGKWVAASSSGIVVVGETERAVRDIADKNFPFGIDEYHVDCIGCEIMQIAVMHDTAPGN
jgi:hypothetical protein